MMGDVMKPAARLDELLDDLAKLGNVRLSLLRSGSTNDGWYASIKMNISCPGEFKIASDFGHPTTFSAVEQLRARVRQAIEKMHSTVATKMELMK